MGSDRLGFPILVLIGLIATQPSLGQVTLEQSVVDGIQRIEDSIRNIEIIVESVEGGKSYLTKHHPNAQADVAAMLDEMGKTLETLSLASYIVTDFSFVIDDKTFAQEAQRFEDHLQDSQKRIHHLSSQLERLRGHCHKIKEHADRIEGRTRLPFWGEVIGATPQPQARELSEALFRIYDEERNSYLSGTIMQDVIDLALEDVREALGGPGTADPAKVPAAAELLRGYAREFNRLERQSNHMLLKIRTLTFDLQ